MEDFVGDVARFHRACDVPILEKPTIPGRNRCVLRYRVVREEVCDELLPAIFENDLIGIADALADSVYVIIGTALEYGIPFAEVWKTVQAANMAKVDPVTGKVTRRADGKILKPHGWKPPDIKKVLETAD